ncbi:hypothetical protein JIX56_46640 [Streptomyces sp. CA-210063]|nr:hypothetical protein [Streptomyces sp. CA-210063]UUU36694.1 hypothetical protein JIX56_46640 [Streptomyces sp. CA-210063]
MTYSYLFMKASATSSAQTREAMARLEQGRTKAGEVVMRVT